MNKILLIGIILSLTICNSQKKEIKKSNCQEIVLVTYDNYEGDYNTIEIPEKIKENFNWVTIEFHSSLKDSFQIYFDNKLFTTMETEETQKPKTIFYKYDKDKCGVKLFLKSLTNGSCMEILLDGEYNLVKLNRLNNKWKLEYSGYYEINTKN